MRVMHWHFALALVAAAGCGQKPEATQTPAADTAGTMWGMVMQGMQLMPMMGAHLDSVAAMRPEQMATMMATHQDMASRMLDAMGRDMRGMNMTPDAAWTALSDSIRRDLADLPGLSGELLRTRMEAHIARCRRLMSMHQAMMKM